MSTFSRPTQTVDSINALESVLYFSHIPKTGGTSFTAILDRFFDVKDIFQPQLWWEVGDVEAVKKRTYKCIRGHFGIGAQILSNHQLKTLTVLRDPVRMAYSTYQYVKRESNTAVHNYVIENQLTFEDFLQDNRTRNLAKNRLVKSLSFGLGFVAIQKDLVMTPETYKLYRKQLNQEIKEMTSAQKLEFVKNYIDSCFWVGILEDFERSLMLLSYQMSWPVIGSTEKLNSHPNKPEISEQAVALVKQINSLDYELYEYAKASFQGKFKTLLEENNINENDKKFRELVDKKYQKNQFEHNQTSMPEHIIYDFSKPLFGQNWHNREWIEAESVYFRWTGPEVATSIDFWLKPQDYAVSLSFANLSDYELLNNLEIRVNDSVVDWNVKNDGRMGVIYFLCKASYCQQNGLLRIQMITGNLPTHDSVFNSHDGRKVGFAMKSITIQKQEHVDS